MKTMKKLASLTLALLLTIALAAPAFAAGEGSITIENAIEGVTYDAYRILDLETFDSTKNAYLYTVNAAWADFFAADGAAYIAHEVDGVANEYVTIKKATETQTDAEWAAALAADAFTWLDAHTIAASGTVKATKAGDTVTAKMTGLDLGYYLVNSSLGSICSLNTTDLNATIQEKNQLSTLTLKVINSSESAADYDQDTTASYGESVTFQVEIELAATASGDMSINIGKNENLTYGADADTIVTITAEQVASALANDGGKITRTFTATLKDGAATATGFVTTATLTAGGSTTTVSDDTTATVTTYAFELLKTNSNDEQLEGATFTLWTSATEEAEGYKVALTAANQANIENGVITAGSVTVSGLKAGTYYLQEEDAPAGYNKMADRQPIQITNADLTGDSKIIVVNYTGAELPSTGGIGTTIFYVVGGLLAVGAGVLLITRKRVGEEE